MLDQRCFRLLTAGLAGELNFSWQKASALKLARHFCLMWVPGARVRIQISFVRLNLARGTPQERNAQTSFLFQEKKNIRDQHMHTEKTPAKETGNNSPRLHSSTRAVASRRVVATLRANHASPLFLSFSFFFFHAKTDGIEFRRTLKGFGEPRKFA